MTSSNSKKMANGRRSVGRGDDGVNQKRRSTMAKVISIGGLLLSVGTALYRFRKQWVPKAEELGGEIRVSFGRGQKRAGEMVEDIKGSAAARAISDRIDKASLPPAQ